MGTTAILIVIVALGILYRLARNRRRPGYSLRLRKAVVCPENHSVVRVRLRAHHPAGASLLQVPQFIVEDCTLWSELEGCEQKCISRLCSNEKLAGEKFSKEVLP